jgi:ribosomal RNA-processing protein 1
MAAPPTNVPPLAKYLASTGINFTKQNKMTTNASSDKKTRDKAVKNLAVFLSNSSQNVLPDLEMATLWKGIFYCAFASLELFFLYSRLRIPHYTVPL